MKRAVRLYMDGDTLHIALRLHVDARCCEYADACCMIDEGVARFEYLSPYEVHGKPLPVRVHIEHSERFGLDCVNVRVYDKTPVVRRMLDPRINVSRAYFGIRQQGAMKLARLLLRKPDVYINYGGRDASTASGRTLIAAVVMHEFGHVLGLRDKYRRHDGKKRYRSVQDADFMYRAGAHQRPMEYQLEYLLQTAERGRPQLKTI